MVVLHVNMVFVAHASLILFTLSPIRPDPSHHPPRTSQPDTRTGHHGPIAVPRDGQPSSEHSMGARRPENPGQRRAHQPNGKRHFTNHSPAGTSVKIVFKCAHEGLFFSIYGFYFVNCSYLGDINVYIYFFPKSSPLQCMSHHRRFFSLTDTICYHNIPYEHISLAMHFQTR